MDVTRERVRQIEAKTLRKLKHPTRLAVLRAWTALEEKPAAPIVKEELVPDDEEIDDSAPADLSDNINSELLVPATGSPEEETHP